MLVAPLALALATLPAEPKKVVVPAAKAARVVALRRPKAIRPLPPVMAPPPPGGVAGGGTTAIGGAGSTASSALSTSGMAGDESVVKNAKVPTTPAGLLNFFRRRTPPAPDKEEIARLLKKLSSKDSSEQDEAQGELVCIGQPAVPLLRQAANNVDDLRGSARARQALQSIEGTGGSAVTLNAVRLLASARPAGAAEALIGYLPYAEDDNVFKEVEGALVAVGAHGKRPDDALFKALKDKLAIRRGTAAQVLSQVGGPACYKAVRPLLKDANPSVRLRAALGLVGAYDAEAIPVLIDLLAELPPDMRTQAELYLTDLAGEWAVRGPRGNDSMSRALRRDVWAAWWKNTDGAKLLEEFKSRTLADEERDKVLKLIKKLNDPSPDARQAASDNLISMGRKVAPLLRRAVHDGDPKSSATGRQVLQAIEKDTPNPLPTAAPRLLGLRRPEGTVEALIAYLPFAESDDVARQVVDVLASAGCPGGKPDEALLKALSDKVPARRAGAATALCKAHATDSFDQVKKLLKDKDVDVRYRAGQALASAGQKDAVPVLIDLLADLPLEKVWDLEDFLSQIAGDKSPAETVSAEAGSRRKAVKAWKTWWDDHGKKIDLARLDLGKRELGFLLVVEMYNPLKGRGRVLEVDASGKTRWEIGGLNQPYDAQVLRGGNILVVEQQSTVKEMDRSGKVLSTHFYPNVFQAERLRNGHTFVACRFQLQEVDKDGKALRTHFYNMNTILAARRFRDGSVAFVSYSGHYVRLDKDFKEVKSFNFAFGGFGVNGAEVLPGDRIIVSMSNNKVAEFDSSGKTIWDANVTFPGIPFRLSNGHTLVPYNSNQGLLELDRSGKVVKDTKTPSYKPYRVYRR